MIRVLLLAIAAVLSALPAYAVDFYQVNNGATVDITEHSVCKRMTNGYPSGQAIFVPTKTATEWSAFYGATIPGVTIAACPPSCAGVTVGGYCWYLGAAAQSCDAVCGTRGGSTAGTINYAGSSGSAANCQAIMTVLGVPPGNYAELSGYGLGCSASGNRVRRYTSPATTTATAVTGFARACSCAQ